MLYSLLAFVLAAGLHSFSTTTTLGQPVTIEGIVISAETGRPLQDVHVFVIQGEEEALSDARGVFKITT